MGADPATVRYDAKTILEMESCTAESAVERMAHRWYLQAAAQGGPDVLLAPRFARVPPIRVLSPDTARDHEVWASGWSSAGWFSHLRVGHPGAPFPVTVTHPTISGRPHNEDAVLKLGPARLWTAYVFTLPAGTPFIEVSKTEEAEASLVAVEFRPCDAAHEAPCRTEPHANPIVAGIVDAGILASETLQAYDQQPVTDFYRQMRSMGFTHIFQQIYAGRAAWSDIARSYRNTPVGHQTYANWNEPTARMLGDVAGGRNEIVRIHDAGLKMVASFRINNEWMAEWARDMFRTDGIPDHASVLSVERPDLWATYKSGGRSGGGLDFAFEEVRAYRLSIIAEWCDKFRDFDGLCIDLYRHPPMVSYPECLVQAFKEKTGIDVRTVEPVDQDTMIPEWHKFRAAPFTDFMRSVRALLSERYGKGVGLTARVANTYERAMLDGADLKTWFAEGIVDQVVLQHRPPANPLEADSRPIIDAAHARGVEVVHLLGGWHGVDFDAPDLAPILPLLHNWRAWGSDGFGFYEAERIGRDGRWVHDMPTVVKAWEMGQTS